MRFCSKGCRSWGADQRGAQCPRPPTQRQMGRCQTEKKAATCGKAARTHRSRGPTRAHKRQFFLPFSGSEPQTFFYWLVSCGAAWGNGLL
ncbi:hypothetical protein [Pandoravirus japonicus]|uniref:Uncharacterized protein n=1 Tax=Pandoravirus japonicus TaxID=2823154 RepID=A0A811BS31_9VIRU|nr:hypothetical protein [Pandoravirus japonicus]